jgi:hypothetical protein
MMRSSSSQWGELVRTRRRCKYCCSDTRSRLAGCSCCSAASLCEASVFFEMRAYVCSLPDQAPANRNSWAIGATDVNVVVQVPDRGLATGRIVKQIIRMPVTVKVSRSH